MDVLVRQFPAPLRAALRWAELALLVVVVGFALVESTIYTERMYRIGLRSNTAEIPLWIPHGMVALGFGLIALIAVWRSIEALRRGVIEPEEQRPPAGHGAEP
jgi:TRAP-type C4-dicarboxylate transport system permease small subunit